MRVTIDATPRPANPAIVLSRTYRNGDGKAICSVQYVGWLSLKEIYHLVINWENWTIPYECGGFWLEKSPISIRSMASSTPCWTTGGYVMECVHAMSCCKWVELEDHQMLMLGEHPQQVSVHLENDLPHEQIRNQHTTISGWWFWTYFMFHILGIIIIPTDELIFFRGVFFNNMPSNISSKHQ